MHRFDDLLANSDNPKPEDFRTFYLRDYVFDLHWNRAAEPTARGIRCCPSFFLLPNQRLYIVKNICVCVCVRARACMCVFIYIHTHTHTHTPDCVEIV